MPKTHCEIRRVNGKRVASPEYRAWQSMKRRCYNKQSKDYPYYGGRGIKVCARWANSFENFLSDMGRRPSNVHTLDRKDSDGDYELGNCRWATRLEQARNREYARTKTWLLAEQLSVKTTTAAHYIWQVRSKDRGHTENFELSPKIERAVREFLGAV